MNYKKLGIVAFLLLMPLFMGGVLGVLVDPLGSVFGLLFDSAKVVITGVFVLGVLFIYCFFSRLVDGVASPPDIYSDEITNDPDKVFGPMNEYDPEGYSWEGVTTAQTQGSMFGPKTNW